jgi:hypothetical protein
VACSGIHDVFLTVEDQPALFIDELNSKHVSWVYPMADCVPSDARDQSGVARHGHRLLPLVIALVSSARTTRSDVVHGVWYRRGEKKPNFL